MSKVSFCYSALCSLNSDFQLATAFLAGFRKEQYLSCLFIFLFTSTDSLFPCACALSNTKKNSKIVFIFQNQITSTNFQKRHEMRQCHTSLDYTLCNVHLLATENFAKEQEFAVFNRLPLIASVSAQRIAMDENIISPPYPNPYTHGERIEKKLQNVMPA